MEILKLFLDWSEVWALFIPLIVLLKYSRQPGYMRPIIWYVYIAILLNFVIDLFGYHGESLGLPEWLRSNNYLYNVQSVVRFICFSLFFNHVLPSFRKLRTIISIVAGLFLLVNFIFFENFFNFGTFSSRLLTVEASLLLVYCLQFYFYKLRDDDPSSKRKGDFWVVTGLCIYVVINFFIFLFYTTLNDLGYGGFLMTIWNVHNISYIVLCILLAKAFYDPARS
jgi:hypothetical protein